MNCKRKEKNKSLVLFGIERCFFVENVSQLRTIGSKRRFVNLKF
jgi:hypothetical protein